MCCFCIVEKWKWGLFSEPKWAWVINAVWASKLELSSEVYERTVVDPQQRPLHYWSINRGWCGRCFVEIQTLKLFEKCLHSGGSVLIDGFKPRMTERLFIEGVINSLVVWTLEAKALEDFMRNFVSPITAGIPTVWFDLWSMFDWCNHRNADTCLIHSNFLLCRDCCSRQWLEYKSIYIWQ